MTNTTRPVSATRGSLLCIALLLGCFAASCAAESNENLSRSEAKELAKTAFFWGMHQVAYYHFRHNYVQNEESPVYAGLNRLGWNRKPITADFRAATTPNATTMYGIGVYDLRDDPVVIVTPAIEGYWSVQATDQYARWFLQAGNQWTGSEAQQALLIGPNWSGQLPAGFTGAQILRVPSNFVFLIYRLGLKSYSDKDVAAVNDLMDSITAVPLSMWEENGRKTIAAKDQEVVKGDYQTLPGMDEVADPSKLEAEKFYQWVSLVINDPVMTKRLDSHKEVTALRDIEKLGTQKGAMFDINSFSKEQQEAIREGFEEAKKEAAAAVTSMLIETNGWNLSSDYNYDETNWVLRAGFGLLAIAAPVPAYSHSGALGMVGSKRRPLHGDHKYTLTLDMDDLPPVTEFWSIPLYDLAGYFVNNPINRYTVNSFMLENGDFHITADRKLVFYLQAEKPGDSNHARNWLPAPKGEGFRLTARFYGPYAPLIDGSYKMPLPVRVE